MSHLVTIAILTGCLMDLILADPPFLPHPVVWMGKYISFMEKLLRKYLPKSPSGEIWGGRILAFSLPVLTWILTSGICVLCYRIHPVLYFMVQAFWCYQALAAKGLANEANTVGVILQAYSMAGSDIEQKKDISRKNKMRNSGNIEEVGKESGDEVTKQNLRTIYLRAARKQVGRIVGRDTESLDEAGIIRASVETVAENSSDGVAAPLIYMLIGGAPLALTYKAINTMDSMVGYKNERYQYFGRAAAKLDDVANFIPSRIAAMFWIAASFIDSETDGRNAWRIFKRDRGKHASPNSAQTESACAGALHVRLAGPSTYFGKLVVKPYIGDDDRPIEREDIQRSIRLMWICSVLTFVAGMAVRMAILL